MIFYLDYFNIIFEQKFIYLHLCRVSIPKPYCENFQDILPSRSIIHTSRSSIVSSVLSRVNRIATWATALQLIMTVYGLFTVDRTFFHGLLSFVLLFRSFSRHLFSFSHSLFHPFHVFSLRCSLFLLDCPLQPNANEVNGLKESCIYGFEETSYSG